MNKGKEGRHSSIFDNPEFLTAMLIMAVESDDEEKIHGITGKIMSEMLNDFMEIFSKWGGISLLRGVFLGSVQIFTDTIKTLCDEDDIAGAEHLRNNTEVTTMDLGAFINEIRKKKDNQGESEK